MSLPITFTSPPLFEILNPVCEIIELVEDLFVHPVLPLHKGADKVACGCLEFHVRHLGIPAIDVRLGLATERSLWFLRGCNTLPLRAVTRSTRGGLVLVRFAVRASPGSMEFCPIPCPPDPDKSGSWFSTLFSDCSFMLHTSLFSFVHVLKFFVVAGAPLTYQHEVREEMCFYYETQ